MQPLRVAYFPDSFHEVNGVAHTSRNFVAFAQRRELPFLCVRAGNRAQQFEQAGELRTLELERSQVAVGMEKDLTFDPLFWRYASVIEDRLREFKPDVIHITGPSELGIFGTFFAWKLGIPLAASWHTNVHEYAGRRLIWLTRWIPGGKHIEQAAEAGALNAAGRFYRLGRVLFAPNEELCAMLREATGRACHLMRRGVDTELFSPERRTRPHDDELVLGYVGRLSVEKNVSLLARVQHELEAAGVKARFLLVGHGAEEATLRRELPNATFAGVLRGVPLAEAYANMDVLVFPSHTDTFGNVVLEALASGVPAVVTPNGGPKFIVRDGETGYVRSDGGFAHAVAELAQNRDRLQQMSKAARAYALGCSWDSVFERVYTAYEEAQIPQPQPV